MILRSFVGYSTHYQKLPSGLFQGAILPKIAFPGNDESKDTFLIISEDTSIAKNLFFRHLDEKTEVPLHISWLDWLWNVFLEKIWITPLVCLNGDYKGYLVEVNRDELGDVITTAIVNNNSGIADCFKKGV